jgi:CRISPR type III-B/RAMP module RAMP protein Cmr1
MNYTRETYRCELLTPLIMAGANQGEPELRAASIKGALRWWWRATQADDDIPNLHQRELQIFGGVFNKDRKQHKSQVSISVRWEKQPKHKRLDQFTELNADSIRYLAYGALGEGDNQPRSAFCQGEVFYLAMKYPSQLASTIKPALSVLLTYGGFGMKSKNGFGQVYCEEIETPDLSPSEASSSYPHFKNWDHEVIRIHKEANRAHEAVANAYYISKNPRKNATGRTSPVTATLSSSGDKNLFASHSPKQFILSNTNTELERKAKPLQLYVQRLPEGKHQSGIIAFPYTLGVKSVSGVKPPNSNRGELNQPTASHSEIVKQFMQNVRKNTSRS